VALPFELRLAVFGHGWVDLAPNRWTADPPILTTAAVLGQVAADIHVRQDGPVLHVRVETGERLGRAERQAARVLVGRMLRLDQNFNQFWQLCAATPRLQWAARRGAGRLLCGGSVFEDLVKLLLTTNCSWAATRGMVRRLIEALGTPTPAGSRTFPSARVCAEGSERFFRDVVRAGYRARAVARMAADFASGALSEEHFAAPGLSTDELRRRLLELPGFGPYAAGQALRLLGHYSDLALDSWCRAKLSELNGGRVVTDAQAERRYAPYGCYRGLVLWLDCTAHWHGEGPHADAADPVLQAGNAAPSGAAVVPARVAARPLRVRAAASQRTPRRRA
jgi:N-glycosylase/DNA lyase